MNVKYKCCTVGRSKRQNDIIYSKSITDQYIPESEMLNTVELYIPTSNQIHSEDLRRGRYSCQQL